MFTTLYQRGAAALSWLETLLSHTPRLGEAPKPFGAFHLISLGLILGLFVLMILLRRRLPSSDKAVHRVLTVFAIGLLLLEMGKQILCSYDPANGWAYNWERFPFQFCSVPIYVALIAAFLPKGKAGQALLCFLATYSPVAGASVLVYPARAVFSEILFLDVHTMLWHGAMLLFGLYLWLSGAVTAEWRTAGYASMVYAPMPFIALVLNEASYAFGFAAGYDFNMFYIGRLGKCTVPVLMEIQKSCPYPVFFLSYFLTLGTGGLLLTLVMMGIRWGRERAG